MGGGGVMCDRLASHPSGVTVLPHLKDVLLGI